MLKKIYKTISDMKTGPQIFLPKPMTTKKSNYFHNSVKFIIVIAQYFGFFPILGLSSGSWRNVSFKWWSAINVYSMVILFGAIMQSIISFCFLVSTRNFQRFNNIVFYIRGSLTCYLFIRLARSWPDLMKEFAKVESVLRHYPLTRVNITRKLRIISICIFAVAAFEYICSQIGNFLKALNCGKNRDGGVIEFYFTTIEHPQAFNIFPYSIFIAIIFQLLTIIMTFGWNFLDAFVILVSIAFSSKLIQFEEKINFLKNQRIDSVKIWKHIREDYSLLCHLFKKFNSEMNGIIMVSFITNVFFILWQLFSSLTMVQTGLLQAYYVLSLFLLISRISFVCISGAQFYNESLHIISALTTSNSAIYNEEIERFIVEVDAAPLILSGGNFFHITKGLILELAGAIVTYELVLIQFSNQMLDNSIQNASLCGSMQTCLHRAQFTVLVNNVCFDCVRGISFLGGRENDTNMVIIFQGEDLPVPQKKSQKLKTDGKFNRSFHDSVKYLLFTCQFFALFPLNGVLESNHKNMYFSWFSLRTISCLIVSCAAVLEGIWCIYFLTQKTDRFEIYELNVVMFYLRGTLTCLAFLKLAKNWPSLMEEFELIEDLLKSYPNSKFLHKKLRIITFGIFFAAAVEHFSVQFLNLLKAFRCEETVAESFHRFFAYLSYRQIFMYVPYNFFLGLFLQLLNMIITFGWTFIDVFIVYASINFSEKLVQLDKQVCLTIEKKIECPLVWRTLRENYTRLLHLFTDFNENLNDIILVSFTSNIFFLLTQIFSWMRTITNGNGELVVQHTYFFFSISLLTSRTAFVCYYGASIQEESSNLVNTLVTTPSNIYNEEVERFIVQVNTSPMILSGCKYFYITRSLILKIAGSIVTYELVMIQFTSNIYKNKVASEC
ncbi:uncharacterized protein LOC123678726 [Harmonia axyridis]|uniref:uncharacterized protein LOC123678726 n=1 Tax=Harmonia axyridis TaxID=115357 RepID=UPI001E2757B6|nr:uncharacterized protein LOC123678726 [Harmonia axyridis]